MRAGKRGRPAASVGESLGLNAYPIGAVCPNAGIGFAYLRDSDITIGSGRPGCLLRVGTKERAMDDNKDASVEYASAHDFPLFSIFDPFGFAAAAMGSPSFFSTTSGAPRTSWSLLQLT